MLKNPMVRRLIGAVLALIGLGGAVASGMQAFRQYGTSNWPSVEGRVVSSGVDTTSGRKGRTNFVPAVSYEYEVAGTRFTGSRITIAKVTYSSETSAKAVADTYANEATVKVHYEQTNPGSSVLQTGLGTDAVLQPALMIGLCLVGVVIVLTTKDPAGSAA